MDFKVFYKTVQFDIDNDIRTVYQATQGDTKSRGLLVDLIVGGVKTPVTTETMNFFALKPDGTRVMTAGVKEGTGFKIDFTNQTFAVPGILLCALVLYGTNGEKIADKKFKMTVDTSLEDGAIISKDERGILDRAFDLANDIVPRLEALDVPLLENLEQEVITARGTGATLGARLDSTDAQLAETDQRIDEIKTTYFKTGKNMFNKAKATVNYSVSSTTGKLVVLEGFATSDFIPVLPNTTYTRSHKHTLAYYDINKTFISGISSAENIFTFTTPANTYFIRTSIDTLRYSIDALQVELGSSSTVYESYYEKIPKEYLEEFPYDANKIKNASIEPLKTTFFKPGKNLFDKTKVTTGYSVDSVTGLIVANPGYSASDFIPVLPNTTYTRSHEHTLAYYDSNKVFISGIGGAENIFTFTTPANAYYVRLAMLSDTLNVLQVELGSSSTSYEAYRLNIEKELLPDDIKEPQFVAEFSTTKTPSLSDSGLSGLALLAIKTVQYDDTTPDTVGYLYLDITTQKLYYSKGTFNRPEYLCDWNSSLSGGVSCENYQATITNDGDIIFMKNWSRANPIMYPANDYSNPFVIDFGINLKPICWLTSTGVGHHPTNDYFVFGEYKNHSLADEQNNDPRNIWKVTKPYSDINNWVVKQQFKHVFYESPVSNEPDIEIGHVHTIVRDFFNGAWYCSTGDIDRHCRVWESLDEGNSWHEVAVNGQKWRALGMCFTEESAYWGTDSHYYQHCLYRVSRNPDTGILDFTTQTKIADLDFAITGGTQPTYANCYLREPHGILFLDRAEPRPDFLLDLVFWSFKYEKLFKVGTYKRVKDASEQLNRHGFGNQVVTTYQPTMEDGIIAGGGTVARQMTLDLLGHRTTNPLGNIKIKIREI